MVADSDSDDDSGLLFATLQSTRSSADIEAAEAEITQNIRDIRYIVREYPAEVVVQKYLRGRKQDQNEIYVPDYQRDLVWQERNQSRFIESMLIGLPIPFLFVADVSEAEDPDNAGRLEIVDGVQRIRTLARFLTNDLTLSHLERLKKLNGFRFCDLHPARQRRFRRATLRLIELTEGITEDVRREMFDRINTGSVKLEDVEVRRGMQPGPFVDLTTDLAGDPLLQILAPISERLKKRFEYEELVTRFFAFLNRYRDYGTGPEGKVVREFLLSYVRDTNEVLNTPDGTQTRANMKAEWSRMLSFVRDNFPEGFRKTGRGRKVPRVRFEAIAVGVALALRSNPNLVANRAQIEVWLESEEFREWTTSDAANNRSSVQGRIEFVRDKLLGQ
ncbi:MAG TPA: DUF262 domain-containing protein [Acetobacteraceae bacterium]|nr:DUF262 domain-containing protein [Acetobacteraceae bacterium]